MLIEFSVSNFRCIAEKITFSMLAEKMLKNSNHLTISTNNSFAPQTYASSVIVGGNGAGKTTLFDAMAFMKDSIITDLDYCDYDCGFEEFIDSCQMIRKFEPNLLTGGENKPSEFEITYSFNDAIYQYGFIIENKQVKEEWLFRQWSKSCAKMATLFRREGDKLEINKNIKDFNIKLKKNILLASNYHLSDIPEELTSPYEFFNRSIHINDAWRRYKASIVHTKHSDCEKAFSEIKEDVIHWIKTCDFGIEDVDVENYQITFYHKDDNGDLKKIPLHMQSIGFQNFFRLLVYLLLDGLKQGGAIIIDRLDENLHPELAAFIIETFQDPKHNKNGAQLIFNTHSYISFEGQLNKEQIWITDRSDGRRTTLLRLDDFIGVRDHHATHFSKSYLIGAYGGMPNIGELDDV